MHYLSTFSGKVHYNYFNKILSSQKYLVQFFKDLIYIDCWLTCFPCKLFVARGEESFTFSAFLIKQHFQKVELKFIEETIKLQKN